MKCEGETGTEAGLRRGSCLAVGRALQLSRLLCQPSLQGGNRVSVEVVGEQVGFLSIWEHKRNPFWRFNVSDLFIFFPVIPSIAGRDFGIRAFNVCDVVIKYSHGAIQVIDSRVARTWSHQMGVARYSRLSTLQRFFSSHSVWSSTKPSSSHSCTSAPKFRLYGFLRHVIVYMTENGMVSLWKNEFMTTQGCNDLLIHRTW